MGPTAALRSVPRSAFNDSLASFPPFFITASASASVFGGRVASVIAFFSFSLNSLRRTAGGLAAASSVMV